MEEQYPGDEFGSAARDASKKMGRAVRKAAGKAVRKTVVRVTIATGGGCLIPLLLLILVLLMGGFISAMTLNRKYDYDEIKKQAETSGISAKELLFNQLYSDVSGQLFFTDAELEAMVFDKKSLKYIFELVAEYNNEQLTRELDVEFEGTYNAWTADGGYVYHVWDGTNLLTVSEEEYKEYEENEPGMLKWKQETGYYTSYDAVDVQTVTLDNTWLREKYPIDWQIVYVLCFYDSLDYGEKSQNFGDDGKKIRLSKSYVESVIEEVASGAVKYVPDVSADYSFLKVGGIGNEHELDAINYNWGFNLGFGNTRVSQNAVSEYGAYIAGAPYRTTIWHGGSSYYVDYKGNIPISLVQQVQTLTGIDSYKCDTGRSQSASDLYETVYDLSKLEALLEKYGHGRSLNLFVGAVAELPGGELVAAEIEHAQMKIEEAKSEKVP